MNYKSNNHTLDALGRLSLILDMLLLRKVVKAV